jgi:hypothetical protein
MRRSLFLILFASILATACGSGPTKPLRGRGVGDAGPEFRLPSAQGGTVALADYRSKRDVLLYFSMGPG